MCKLEEKIRVLGVVKEGLKTKCPESYLFESIITLDLSFIKETLGKVSLLKLVNIINDATNKYVFTGKGYTVRLRALNSKRDGPVELVVEEEEPNMYNADVPVFWLLGLHLDKLKKTK